MVLSQLETCLLLQFLGLLKLCSPALSCVVHRPPWGTGSLSIPGKDLGYHSDSTALQRLQLKPGCSTNLEILPCITNCSPCFYSADELPLRERFCLGLLLKGFPVQKVDRKMDSSCEMASPSAVGHALPTEKKRNLAKKIQSKVRDMASTIL